MIAEQLRNYVIRPVLDELAIKTAIRYSEVAEDLLMLTACAESLCGQYIQQVKGPAQGIFQMEPATHYDILENFTKYRADINSALASFRMKEMGGITPYRMDMYNPVYAAAACRVHYYRVPQALPNKDLSPSIDHYLIALASYWKEHYNTHMGKGTVDKAVELTIDLGDITF